MGIGLLAAVLYVRLFGIIFPFGRRLVSVSPVEIWPQSAQFES